MALTKEVQAKLEPAGFASRVTRWYGQAILTGDVSGGYNSLIINLGTGYMIGRNWQWSVSAMNIQTAYTATATYAECAWVTGQYYLPSSGTVYMTNLGQLAGGLNLMQVGTYQIPWLNTLIKPSCDALSLLYVAMYITNVTGIQAIFDAHGFIWEEPIVIPAIIK